MTLANNFEEILVAFNKHKVNYMIVGGYAVIFHGYGRTTGDLDLWVKPSEENKKKLLAAFKNLHYPQELLDTISDADFSKPFSIKIGNEPIQVDIFNAITGVSYEVAEKNSILYKFDKKATSRFIHLYDLMVNKMLTGRLRDKADAEELQKINMHSKNKNILAALKKFFGRK